MFKYAVTAVIPAYNEENTIAKVVKETLQHVEEVIVVDDGSTDKTATRAKEAGAKVIYHRHNMGVLEATRTGIHEAIGEIIITLDADEQHNPQDIPCLIQPIIKDEADLVLGERPSLPHLSEKILTILTSFKVPCKDASTGYRAIKKSIANKMKLHGACLCGTFILEAQNKGARVTSIPINIKRRQGDRRIKPKHIKQIFWVIYDILHYK